MTYPVVDTVFVPGTTITHEWLNGVNDYVNESNPADHSAANVEYFDTFNNTTTNVETALQEHIRGNTGKQHFGIGAIPRCTAGVFSLINDSGHNPLNVSSVTQPDTYTIRVNYAKTASKINSFIAAPDAELSPYGVVCGGDVGLSYANIQAFAPFSCYVKMDTSPVGFFNDLWNPSITNGTVTVTKVDNSQIKITHPPAVDRDTAIVCAVNDPSGIFTPVVSFNSTEIDIIMMGDAGGFISYNGSSFTQSFSDNLTAPTLTWTASNTLKVQNTAAVTTTIPIVTGHGGVYLPQVVDKNTDYFEVAFYDYAGTKITTPDTNMKFWYRLDARVPVTWPTGVFVSAMRGLCHVPSANFSGVAGNNLWVDGTMEY